MFGTISIVAIWLIIILATLLMHRNIKSYWIKAPLFFTFVIVLFLSGLLAYFTVSYPTTREAGDAVLIDNGPFAVEGTRYAISLGTIDLTIPQAYTCLLANLPNEDLALTLSFPQDDKIFKSIGNIRLNLLLLNEKKEIEMKTEGLLYRHVGSDRKIGLNANFGSFKARREGKYQLTITVSETDEDVRLSKLKLSMAGGGMVYP